MADASLWAAWVARLQALAQTGLTYSTDVHDRERYQGVRQLAREAAAALAGSPPETIPSLFAAEDGYATPKVDVRAAVFRGDQLLFVRERSDGLWALPGGWADVGQSPAECVEREVAEESGYLVKARRLVAVWDRTRHPHPPMAFHVYKMVFLCDLVGGDAAPSVETSEVGFFAEHEIPALSLGRIVPAQIDRIFTHARNPALPCEFD